MNILFLAAYPPVLHMHGGGVRMFHNIRILASKHCVRVVSFVEGEEEREMLRSLHGICESVTAIRRVPDFQPHWFSLLPFLVREFSTPEMYRVVDEEFQDRKVDVLQCEYLQMAQFHHPGALNVLTIHEPLSANAYETFLKTTDPIAKLRSYYRWMALLRYEVLMSRKFDRVVTMTEADADYLRSYSPDACIRAIPIGIDPEEFTPLPEDPSQQPTVLFVGNFRHEPNVEAADFLVREIAPAFPDVHFLICGSNVPDSLSRAANVTFPGYVRDTRKLYRTPNTIVAAPLFSGTGQRVKLLEAFAMACPVVSTSLGSAGFPIRNGIEALIADSAEDFRSALQQLLESEDLRRRIGANARAMIVANFSWDHIGSRLLDVVEGRGLETNRSVSD
jgi:glycosyltransferase involved in cell wall biosynthesis